MKLLQHWKRWNDKASGLSGLVAEMIQATGDIGTQWILDLCNSIVKEGCIPEDWKSSVVLPIYTLQICICEKYNSLNLWRGIAMNGTLVFLRKHARIFNLSWTSISPNYCAVILFDISCSVSIKTAQYVHKLLMQHVTTLVWSIKIALFIYLSVNICITWLHKSATTQWSVNLLLDNGECSVRTDPGKSWN